MERIRYHWPVPEELNGSGDLTRPAKAKAMLQCLRNLGEILQDIQETLQAPQKGKHLQIDLKALWASSNSKTAFLDTVADLMNSHQYVSAVFEDTSHPDYKGNLGESEERRRSRMEKVRVYEHHRYRDGGTIEYRDRHNRRYVVPAPVYQLTGIYSDSNFTSSLVLVDIELEIVPGTEPL